VFDAFYLVLREPGQGVRLAPVGFEGL
jgi:hypothetical protein